MSEMPRVAVVSVTYNRCRELLVLMGQLRGLDYPRDRLEVFLVDNASADDTVARVRAEFPEVRLTCSPENLGTSAGFNEAMRQALDDPRGFEYVWLLDSDAEVEPSTLSPLVRAMQAHGDLGIVGSTIYDPSERDRVVTSGLRMDWDHGAVGLNKNPASDDGLVEAHLIAACSLLARASLCRDIGLWDERFWVYWGDTDWCLRARRRGYRVCGHLGSRTWHRDWANTPQSFRSPAVMYDDLRGALLVNARHAPNGSRRGLRFLLAKTYAKVAFESFTTRPHFAQAADAAVDDFFRGRFGRRRYEPDLSAPVPFAELLAILGPELPRRARVLIDRLPASTGAVVRQAVRERLPEARIEEIPDRPKARRSDFTTDYAYYLLADVSVILRRLFRPRADLVVSEIAKPHVYAVFVGRWGAHVDRDGRGITQRNRRGRAIARFAATILRGLRLAAFGLPKALRGSADLRQAVASGPGAAERG